MTKDYYGVRVEKKDAGLDVGGKGEDAFKNRPQVSLLDNGANGSTIY